jgi:hypothetical protein
LLEFWGPTKPSSTSIVGVEGTLPSPYDLSLNLHTGRYPLYPFLPSVT